MTALAIFGLDWSMQMAYIACAAGGGTVLVLQTVLLLLGAGHGGVDLHDVDVGGADVGGHAADVDHSDGAFGLFSLRALASFFTFFGLTGWWGTTRGWEPTATVVVSTAAGAALMLAVAWMLRAQRRLESRGNLEPRNAVGLSARVYLRVPGSNTGFGKITVKLQGRTAEFNAFTLGPELPTGALVKIARMSTPDTFEVVPLNED